MGYFDPGSGSFILQLLIAAILGSPVLFIGLLFFIYRVRKRDARRKSEEEPIITDEVE